MFQKKQKADRIARATDEVRRMGYDFHIPGVLKRTEFARPCAEPPVGSWVIAELIGLHDPEFFSCKIFKPGRCNSEVVSTHECSSHTSRISVVRSAVRNAVAEAIGGRSWGALLSSRG